MPPLLFSLLCAAPPPALSPAEAFPGPDPRHPLRAAAQLTEPAAIERALRPLQGGPLGSYAALRLAQADPRRRPTLKDPGADAPWREPTLQLKAEALERTAPARAAELLEAIEAPAQIARAAALYARAGLQGKAARLRVELLLRWPDSDAAEAALRGSAVERLLPRRADRLRYAEALLNAHENEPAAALLSRLSEGARPKERCLLAYLSGKAARKLRRYRAAIPALSRAREICNRACKTSADCAADKERARAAALLLAQVQSILGRKAGLRRSLAWFEREAPGHRYHDDVLFSLAKAEGDARARYAQLLRKLPRSDHAPLAAWRLAFGAIQRGQAARAISQLSALLKRTDLPPMQRARALYWRARVQEDRAPAAARADYRALTARPSFYSWLTLSELSRRRPSWAAPLKARLQEAAHGQTTPPRATQLLERAELKRARAYAAAGLNEAAATALSPLLEAEDLSPHQRLWLAHCLERLGAHTEAQHALRWSGGPKTLTAQTLNWWRTAYSRPFKAPLTAAAKAERLDPLLLFSLAREESTFDPKIVSWAGAIGLTQLMPRTARGAYDQVFGRPLGELDALLEPRLNLRLGAHVLASGLRSFKKIVALGLSAYNGGPRLTRRFLPGRAQRFDLWVESISVRETRRYVRRVIESYGIYRLLWADESFLTLPEQIPARATFGR